MVHMQNYADETVAVRFESKIVFSIESCRYSLATVTRIAAFLWFLRLCLKLLAKF